MKLLLALLTASVLLASAPAQDANAPLRLLKTIPLPKVEGRIDHLAADVAGQRLFVAALENNTLEVVDLQAGKALRSLPGFAKPQGIAYVPELNRIFVANGRDGSCRILDGHSFETLASVQCGDDADNVRYDPKAGRIYVGYGGGALAVLEAKTGSKLADIKLAGHPESFRLESGSPRIYVNVPQAEHIAVVNRDRGAVTATWPLKEAQANFPLSLDQANHRLFSGCRNPARVLIYDCAAPAGRQVAAVPIAGDTDDLFYDTANRCLYVSCGQGFLDVIRQTDADHYSLAKSIPTAAGARTSLFVPELKLLCLAVPHRGAQLAEIRVFKTQ